MRSLGRRFDLCHREEAQMSSANILYETKDGVAYISLNRPQVLNALYRKTLEKLTTVLREAANDPAVLGVILTESDSRAAITWADICELSIGTTAEGEQFAREGDVICDLIKNLGKPVIAAVRGFALADGCEAAMACTIRLAAEGAKFGLSRMSVGKELALQPMLLVEIISAQEARRIGLVSKVVPAEHLISCAEAILKQISAYAPFGLSFSPKAKGERSQSSQTRDLVLESSFG
jgi:enoyl-CoA hydratase/carnithine racemase